jgi:hypothetical protein
MRLIAFILLFTSFLFADNTDGQIFSEYSALPDQNQVVLTWQTKDSFGIRQFVILRSSDDQNFFEIARVSSLGPGVQHKYIDTNVIFNSGSAMFYKIRAIDESGASVGESGSLLVHPSVSTIFRTWGTLKAVFR